MSRKFALRVDVVDGEVKPKLKKWLDVHACGFICAEELAEANLHVHLILDSVEDIKKLRNSLVRAIPQVSGNKGYSLKVCDDDWDGYMRYICKGSSKDETPVIWYRHGLDYTEENILSAHSRYWVNNDALRENSVKRQKVEKANIVEQIEKICKDEGVKSIDRVGIARVYMRLFRDARKGINIFAARAVVNTVSLLLENPDCSETSLAMKIADL